MHSMPIHIKLQHAHFVTSLFFRLFYFYSVSSSISNRICVARSFSDWILNCVVACVRGQFKCTLSIYCVQLFCAVLLTSSHYHHHHHHRSLLMQWKEDGEDKKARKMTKATSRKSIAGIAFIVYLYGRLISTTMTTTHRARARALPMDFAVH